MELLLNEEQIRNKINLKTNDWKYHNNTNCYAFALGLDVKENEICKNAYTPGIMGINLLGYNLLDLDKMNIEERFLLDLKALGINWEEISPEEKVKITESYLEWKVALYFYQKNNQIIKAHYHFIREGSDLTWYHKFGFGSTRPSNLDYDEQVIKELKEANMYNYVFYKCYKLKLKQ